MVTLQTETPKGAVAAPNVQAAPASPVLTADGESATAKGIQVTVRALKRIRIAMAKEHITPEAGGLRVGITGGGCSGLSYNIRFDNPTPRPRPRLFLQPSPSGPRSDRSAAHPHLRRPQELHLPARHDPRLRRDTHAPGLQLHQSPLHQILRMRLQLLHIIVMPVTVFTALDLSR